MGDPKNLGLGDVVSLTGTVTDITVLRDSWSDSGDLLPESQARVTLLVGDVPDAGDSLVDLRERLVRAAATLGGLETKRTARENHVEAARLAGKRSGVLLALSYLDEALMMREAQR